MDTLHGRALRALGWEPDPDGETMYELDGDGCRSIPAEETLIGMLLLELDRLSSADWFMEGKNYLHTNGEYSFANCESLWMGKTLCEALVLAVEAMKEASNVRPE
jgi:hypothetical protein